MTREFKVVGIKRRKVLAEKGARQKILNSALEAFAAYGFEGARVDRIAHEAGVNKAMIFYYFSSKQNLYRTTIKDALTDFIPLLQMALSHAVTPDRLFETLPGLYVRYFAQHKNIIKMIARELIHASHMIAPLIREVFEELPESPSKTLPKIIKEWHRQGLISESDPVHFIFNVVPLCLFPLIAQPMVEAILDVRLSGDSTFLEQRIQSITNLLKRGMLP